MNTQISTQQPNTQALRVPDALKMAIMRKISRLAGIHDELQAHGWTHIITTSELYLLEAEGFMVDFDTGLVVDTLAATGATVNASDATIDTEAVRT